MKKLLSLLSVLTISGTTVPATIAASPYQKYGKFELNRIKRDNEVDFRRSLTSNSFLIVANFANWGRNFAIQLGSGLCLKIKNSTTSSIKSGLKYIKEAITGATAGISAGYVYHKLSGNNETYSYSEVVAAGASGSAWHISSKLSSDIIDGFKSLLTTWIENPHSFKDIIVNSYTVGKGLLISFLNDAFTPQLNGVRAIEV